VFLLSKSERYFFDYKAIETQAKESSLARWDQNIEMQVGTERANGGAKTNGPLRAAGGPHKKDKQRGHSRRHAGFNERWDAMTKEEQCQTARRRDVWWISPACFSDAHFAVMPAELARLCVLAGSKSGDTILDPFSGSGTTGEVALELGRNFIGCELYEKFLPMIERRTSQPGLMLA
jgi:DNA modification methylase